MKQFFAALCASLATAGFLSNAALWDRAFQYNEDQEKNTNTTVLGNEVRSLKRLLMALSHPGVMAYTGSLVAPSEAGSGVGANSGLANDVLGLVRTNDPGVTQLEVMAGHMGHRAINQNIAQEQVEMLACGLEAVHRVDRK